MEAMRGPVRCCVGRGGDLVLCYTEFWRRDPPVSLPLGLGKEAADWGLGKGTG